MNISMIKKKGDGNFFITLWIEDYLSRYGIVLGFIRSIITLLVTDFFTCFVKSLQ